MDAAVEVAVVVAVQTMEPAMFDTLEETATVEAVVAAEAVAATEAAAAIGAAAEEEAMEIGAVAPGNRKHPFSPLGVLRSLSTVVQSR